MITIWKKGLDRLGENISFIEKLSGDPGLIYGEWRGKLLLFLPIIASTPTATAIIEIRAA